MELTTILVVSDIERSKTWYRDVLGAELQGEYGGTSLVFRFAGAWLLVVTGGGAHRGQTDDHVRRAVGPRPR